LLTQAGVFRRHEESGRKNRSRRCRTAELALPSVTPTDIVKL
jgi:hypothetical protein